MPQLLCYPTWHRGTSCIRGLGRNLSVIVQDIRNHEKRNGEMFEGSQLTHSIVRSLFRKNTIEEF